MEEKDTSSLLNVLQNSDKENLAGIIDDIHKSSTNFSLYMDSIIKSKNIHRQDIFQKADIPQKYGYKLLSLETRTKDRDRLLRIFFALGMNLKEVRRALELYPMPALYPKNERDAVLIIAINKGLTDVDKVNEWLIEYGQKPLSRID